MTISQSLSVILTNETSLRIPALLMRISTLPKASKAYLTILSPSKTESKLGMATPPLDLISSTT